MVNAAVWATRFFDLKKRKKNKSESIPLPCPVWFWTTSLFDKGRRKQKI